MSVVRRLGASCIALALVFSPLAARSTPVSGYVRAGRPSHAVVYQNLKLLNGESATVSADGFALIFSRDHRRIGVRRIPSALAPGRRVGYHLPDKGHIIVELSSAAPQPFVADRLVVVYRDGITAPRDVISIDRARLHASVPAYTNDAVLNRTLASIGVDRSERLFRQFSRSTLSALRAAAFTRGKPVLNFANAYRLHLTGASLYHATVLLSKERSITYVSPDWTVRPMHTPAIGIDANAIGAAKKRALSLAEQGTESESDLAPAIRKSGLPSNYALKASAQSLLNSPSVDVAAAYAEIKARFGQLPGQGETITDVSTGDLTDTSNTASPCYSDASALGPTTVVSGGQRYLDWPSMPLIPTYTADDSGAVNPLGEVCNVDPYDGEIGLDFSMMAPLPHDLQRAGEQGSGYSDLLGIAPGAGYRLIVPASDTPASSDIDGALLAAAMQTPRTNVITASLGFGYDQYGFPSRYLEEDPLTEGLIVSIVQQYNIVVCIAGDDGTRTFTNVAIGPSGGSAPTNVVPIGGTPTSLSDDYLSTIPSQVYDSGSIDVGGTTLDDIFANPPQYARTPQGAAQHAYAETRWTGFTNFSSGFGTRVNVSAPADNLLGFEHSLGGAADSVDVEIEGGTSAAAPEAAAAAAVLLQVATLTGHPLETPAAVRTLLEQTGSAVPKVAQADRRLAIGPQIDLRAAVESLLAKASSAHPTPSVARVAIEQRRDYGDLDGIFIGDTDRGDIDLTGGSAGPGADQLAWITIAPDWEFMPAGTTYRLYVKGHPGKPLATTSWARLLPATIFQAAGISIPSSSSQSVTLKYQALAGRKAIVTTTFKLTFGASTATQQYALAPEVPAVVTSGMIPVSYDISNAGGYLNQPQLIVSEPGRINPDTGFLFRPAYTVPLTAASSGTVQVPASALQGGGIYGIGIELDSINGIYSNFAYTRVGLPATGARARSGDGRPVAPLLSIDGSTPAHNLEIPYGSSFQVQYDVSNVTGATGAMLEISAAGPSHWLTYNPFNNPNGTIRDRNGTDSGSVYYAALSGTSGMATLTGTTAGLYPSLYHVVRVVPTNGQQAVGEAGDVSTITMDGVDPLDGGTVTSFAINSAGSDGFLSSSNRSVETFSQTTNQITGTIVSSSTNEYFAFASGVYANDLGLVETESTLPCSGGGLVNNCVGTLNFLNPVTSGEMGSAWNPYSLSALPILGGAANQASDVGAFYIEQGSTFKVYTSNLTTNTNSTLYSIQTPVQSFTSPQYYAIAENTSTNTAVLTANDGANDLNPVDPPTLVTVNLSNGTVGSFAGVGNGEPLGIAIDSSTNTAAVVTGQDAGLSFYNLTAQTGNEFFMPNFGEHDGVAEGSSPVADQTAHQFLVKQNISIDDITNNNALSSVLVYDESGNLLESIERFNFDDDVVAPVATDLQVNPTTRTGYVVGEYQLIPFSY